MKGLRRPIALPHVTIHAGPIGTHTWWVLAGLGALAAQRRIRLSHRPSGGFRNGDAVLTEIGKCRVLFDVSDETEVIGYNAADIIFKRSYHGPYPHDVRPLGLVAGYRLGAERLLRHTVASLAAHHTSATIRRAAKLLLHQTLPPRLTDFVSNEAAKCEQVLFQVRAWPPPPVESRRALTESRARLIRLLRKEFGPSFKGGFMPSPFALQAYPDCVTPHAYDPEGYARLVRDSAVAVSTVGLEGSNPWKLVEYLAGGCAIVSEPLHGQLPTELPPGLTVFNPDDPDACVEQCRRLIDSGQWRDDGLANRGYYDDEVRPDELMWKRLAEIVSG